MFNDLDYVMAVAMVVVYVVNINKESLYENSAGRCHHMGPFHRWSSYCKDVLVSVYT
jgi:hypothetical protein